MAVVGKFFFIKSQMNGMVLDVKGNDRSEGARVQMFQKKTERNDNQLFYEDFETGTIRSKLNDFCLDIAGNSVVLNPYDASNSKQKWQVSENTIRNRKDTNLVIDIANSENKEGARVCGWPYNGGDNQHWTLEHIPPKNFWIRSQLNGKMLDIEGEDRNPGACVVVNRRKSGAAETQLWYQDRYGLIHSRPNNFVLDSSDGSIRLQPFNPNNRNQQWVISGDRIVNRNDQNQVMDIKGADHSDGAKVIAWERKESGNANQIWRIIYV